MLQPTEIGYRTGHHTDAVDQDGSVMNWLVTLCGLVLVIATLRDVFHTLFHPVGTGSLAPLIMKLVWRMLRVFHSRRRISSLTGPLGIVAVIATWAVAAIVGWALIYVAQMPEGVVYSSDLATTGRNEILDSLYLSLVTIATLGFGDIVPVSPWLRVAVPLEALFGFVLVTAAVSWVLQIYPALHRRRVLALELTTLRQARATDPSSGIDAVPTDVLTALTASVVEARNDFTQYGATYYFRDLEADASLAASLEYAIHIANETHESDDPQIRVAGRMLTAAMDRLAELLDEEFLHIGGDTSAIVRAYAADHSHETGGDG